MSDITLAVKWCCRLARIIYLSLLEARPTIQGIFLLRFLAGASFTGPLLAEVVNLDLWARLVIWICALTSIYLLNGIMDVEGDRINGSSRPVARGKLTITQAASVAATLAAISLLGSYASGGMMIGCVVAILFLGWLYSGPPFYLKRWPIGLGLVATSGTVLTYAVGYASNGGKGHFPAFSVFVIIMALWLGLAGQTKDLSDIEGDKQTGRRSGPLLWGEDDARFFFSVAALYVSIVYVLLASLFAPGLLISAFVLLTGAVAIAVVMLGPWSRGDRTRRRRPYWIFMLTQYGANLAIIIS